MYFSDCDKQGAFKMLHREKLCVVLIMNKFLTVSLIFMLIVTAKLSKFRCQTIKLIKTNSVRGQCSISVLCVFVFTLLLNSSLVNCHSSRTLNTEHVLIGPSGVIYLCAIPNRHTSGFPYMISFCVKIVN